MINQDFSDMIACLNDSSVEYIVVGAHAMAHFGYIRATGDIDFFINPTLENSKKTLKALKRFGAPLFSLNDDYFSLEGNFFQIGRPPLRIDLLTRIDGVSFPDAFATAVPFLNTEPNFKIISLENLIKNKESTGRDKDKPDVVELRKLLKKSQEAKA